MALTLTKTRIRAGVWEGVLQSDAAPGLISAADPAIPEIEVVHLEVAMAGVTLAVAPDQPAGPVRAWHLRVPVPANLLSDGVQTFLIRDRASGETLNSFAIVTGAALEEDIRAEVDLLRAELDMLKRAFRRHCLEAPG